MKKPTLTFFSISKGESSASLNVMDVKEHAASILGRKAGIMTRDSLHKTLRRQN